MVMDRVLMVMSECREHNIVKQMLAYGCFWGCGGYSFFSMVFCDMVSKSNCVVEVPIGRFFGLLFVVVSLSCCEVKDDDGDDREEC